MKLADILALHPNATIEAKTTASFYDGSIDYEVFPDLLIIPGWTGPDTEGATGHYGDDIDAVIRDYVTPETLRALDFEDCADNEDSFDGTGYYYATLDGETAPDANGVRLPLAINIFVILHDDKMLNPKVIVRIAELEAIAEEEKLAKKTIWPTDANCMLEEYKKSHPEESAFLANALKQYAIPRLAARDSAELEAAYQYGLRWAANRRLKKEDIPGIAKKLIECKNRAFAANSENWARVFPDWGKLYVNRRPAAETHSLDMEPADAPDQIASENL